MLHWLDCGQLLTCDGIFSSWRGGKSRSRQNNLLHHTFQTTLQRSTAAAAAAAHTYQVPGINMIWYDAISAHHTSTSNSETSARSDSSTKPARCVSRSTAAAVAVVSPPSIPPSPSPSLSVFCAYREFGLNVKRLLGTPSGALSTGCIRGAFGDDRVDRVRCR